MSDRNINDCTEVLRISFGVASCKWLERYPDRSTPFLTETYRSNADQQTDYNQGRTTPGKIITKAKPGQSPHNYLPSFAFDVAFKKKDGSLDWDVNNFVVFAQLMLAASDQIELGGDFTGDFKDKPHFEIKNWTTLIPKA